jgi:hypothetical protein
MEHLLVLNERGDTQCRMMITKRGVDVGLSNTKRKSFDMTIQFSDKKILSKLRILREEVESFI